MFVSEVTLSTYILLAAVALLGHVMALVWILAERRKWSITHKRIYKYLVKDKQLRREAQNSLHAPMHAIILYAFIILGSFRGDGFSAYALGLSLTFVWAEIWHYASHRAFHLPSLHWIHAEHHKSRVNTPFSAISFSFSEKVVFDLGLLTPLALLDRFVNIGFAGICSWYIGYIFINSFSHANFEIKSNKFIPMPGRVLTTTTYHSLHHSRYVGNFGLSTRILDRLFKTEWADYEHVFERVTLDRQPLDTLGEKLVNAGASS